MLNLIATIPGQRPTLTTTADKPIVRQAKNLALTGALTGRNWSLADVCEHLALAYETTVQGTDNQPPPTRWTKMNWTQRAMRSMVKMFMLATGWFPKGVPAPPSVEPTGKVSLRDALQRLDKAAEAFERKLATPGSTWGYHAMLGKMTGRRWARFHEIHAAHHFSMLTRDTLPQR